jgi:aminomethyltransferase
MSSAEGRKTALYDKHVEAGARMVPFAGYLMPLTYEGQLVEHEAVRRDVGLFDLSHMGEFRLRGPGALAAVDRLVTNRISGTEPGQVVYSPLCRPDGTIVDDLLVYHLEDSVLLVVNASNIEKDAAWIREHLPPDVSFEDESEETSLIAIQGPEAEAFLAPLTEAPLENLGYYRSLPAQVAGVDLLLSRTGYTGEDGFELYVPSGKAVGVWEALLEAGEGGRPALIGLAARDTLRFEVGYCLYGNDIDDTTTPLQAGLGWTVKLDKEEFLGREHLLAEKEAKPELRLVGLRLEGRSIPRQGYAVLHGEETVGRVTSGTFSPSLGSGYALAYVPRALGKKGTKLAVDIRGRRAEAVVTPPPFYTEGTRRTN